MVFHPSSPGSVRKAITSVSKLRSAEHARLFPRLDAKAIVTWKKYGDIIDVEDGTKLLQEGDRLYPFMVVLSGSVVVVKLLGQQTITLAIHEANDFVGEVTILANAPCPATAIAQGKTQLLIIPNELFRDAVARGVPEATEVVSALAVRSAEIGAIGRHQEKLASVGRIAAGLAHELNNPASAISRQASMLRSDILRNQLIALQAANSYLPEQQRRILALVENRPSSLIDPIVLEETTYAIEEWLELRRVHAASLYAVNLAEASFTVGELAEFEQSLGSDVRSAVEWLANTLILLSASSSIGACSRRISEIVERMKHYSHLDQSPIVRVDLHKEIDATLSVLASRLSNVTVERHFCPGLPTLDVYANELNQVWTSLIENAVDAMPAGGRLRITTACDASSVGVEFADTGTGISPEIKDCIFDPFFTTKDVGQGYGLGLDYVYRTVVRRHSGDIQFISEPGDTRFRVQLPVALSQPDSML